MLDPNFLIKTLGLKKARVVGKNLMACCLFHKENEPSMGINLFNGRWNCFSCLEKGRKLDTIYFKLNMEVPTTYPTTDGKPFNPEEEPGKMEEEVEPEINQSWMGFLMANPSKALEELHLLGKKDITLDMVGRYRVGYSDKKGSIFFPITVRDTLISYMERNKDWKERYRIRPAGAKKGKLLFGLDQAYNCNYNVSRQKKMCILVESCTDALQVASAIGHPLAVATCGGYISDYHVDMTIKHFDVIYLLPQNDDVGQKWTRDLIHKLKKNPSVKKLWGARMPIKYKDPGMAPFDEIKKALREAKFIL
jgi:hypothetical protein